MAFTEKVSTGAVILWNSTTIDRITDFGIHISCPAVDVSAQDSLGNRRFIPGLREMSFNLTAIWDAKDTVHASLQAAADANTEAPLSIVPVTGQTAILVTCGIESIGRPMSLGDAIKADIVFFVSDPSTIDATTGL